jgi:hypothetical protein
MQEARFVALPDQPPMIAMEKSASDTNATEISLSKPVKIPLVVSVSDDYGLADISLAFKRGTEPDYTRLVAKKYPTPQLDDHGVVVPLDLVALNAKLGDVFRYRVEVRDRKRQMAATAEYVVRLSNDAQSADNKLADLEKSEDTFRDKLVKLIAEQQKVNQAVEKMTGKYAELTEKIQAAKVAAGERPTASPLPQDPTSRSPSSTPRAKRRSTSSAKTSRNWPRTSRRTPRAQRNSKKT